ncbi:polyhomeotic-like protein 3 isoform X2 [Synchiropus splendidus]|uniref:polyhomeotic-like protein 3 isoform X2 n=1 Tax=Synchiropus splendidus TaxID=270530 RepID=UPI00237D915C|nr:polyhomeotic-like protein 3 isoform X2 [Synchiropus splendidus]
MDRPLGQKNPPEHSAPSTPTPPRLTPNPMLLDSPAPAPTPTTSSPPPPLTPAPTITAATQGLKGAATSTTSPHGLVPAPPKLTPTASPALRTYSRPILPSGASSPVAAPPSSSSLSSKSSASLTNGGPRPVSSSTPITPFHTPAGPPGRQVSHCPPGASPAHCRTNQSSGPVRQKVPQQTLLLGKSLRGPGQDQVLLRAQMLILTSAMRPASSSSSSGPASAQLQSLTLKSPRLPGTLPPSVRSSSSSSSSVTPPVSRPQTFPPLQPRPPPGSRGAERPPTPTRHLAVPPPTLYSPLRAVPLRPRLHPPRHIAPSRPQGALLSASFQSSAARQLQIIALSSGHAHSVMVSPDPTGPAQKAQDPPLPTVPAPQTLEPAGLRREAQRQTESEGPDLKEEEEEMEVTEQGERGRGQSRPPETLDPNHTSSSTTSPESACPSVPPQVHSPGPSDSTVPAPVQSAVPTSPTLQDTSQAQLPVRTSQVHTSSVSPPPTQEPAVSPAPDSAPAAPPEPPADPQPALEELSENLSDTQSALSSLSSQSPPSSPLICPPSDPPPLDLTDLDQSRCELQPVAESLDQSDDENQNCGVAWTPAPWPAGREVLTHLVEGFVIQEGLQPFPVNRSSLLVPDQATPASVNGTNGKAPSPEARKSADHSTDSDNEGGGVKEPTAKPGQRDRTVLHCQFCGKRGHAHNFMRSKRFCSTSCARGFNVRLTKRLRALSAGSRSDRPRPLLNRAESVPGKPLLLRLPRDLWSAGRREKEMKETVAEEEEDVEGGEEENEEDVPDQTVTVTTRAEPRARRASAPAVTTTTPTSTFRPPPSQWSVEEVTAFICTLPGCGDVAEAFRLQEIDGQALLLLTEDHLMTSMNIKLGPALKICAHINALKNP